MITTRHKEKSLSVLRDELDELVSKFVRLSAADANGTVTCISCNESLFWKDADCCHYKNRDNMATRFFLPNLAPGCKDCNRFNKEFHIQEWTKKLSGNDLWELEMMAKSLHKPMRYEFVEMIEDYKLKVAELKKLKSL